MNKLEEAIKAKEAELAKLREQLKEENEQNAKNAAFKSALKPILENLKALYKTHYGETAPVNQVMAILCDPEIFIEIMDSVQLVADSDSDELFDKIDKELKNISDLFNVTKMF